MVVKGSKRGGRVEVTCDGRGVEGRAGAALLVEAADRFGLTGALVAALGGVRSWRDHNPGVVMRDLAVMLADGGTALVDIEGLRRRDPALFGQVASEPTVWRTVEAVAADELALTRMAAARARTRARVWEAGGAPPVLAVPGEALVIDIDATLVTAHSDKDGAAGTYKHTYGFHPIFAFLDRGDGTGEALAGILRPGNAGSNTAADHCDVLELALDQLPPLPPGTRVMVRTDGAGATKDFLRYAGQAGVGFSTSIELTAAAKDAIRGLDEAAWVPAVRQDGSVRDDAHVAELTGLVALAGGWPAGARLVVRREPLHPGAQQTLDDIDGHRFTGLLTDADDDVVTLDRRHRARARIEDRIRCAKTLGLRNLPCGDFDRNAVWVALVLTAADLVCWTQALCLTGDLAKAEPDTLRHRLWHTAARISVHARRTLLRLQHDWPWAADLAAAFHRLRTLPLPAT